MFNQRCWYVYTRSPVVSAWGWISGYIEPCDTWFKVFVVQYCFKVEFCILNMYSVVYILLHCHFPNPCRYKKTVPQLLIHWSIQKNYITIPKSTKPERILENADVFDFTISDKDMRTLVGLITYIFIIA